VCRILADTPFPFPWAQLLTLFLVAYAVSLPFLVVAFVKDVGSAAALTFIAVLTYWSTNEVLRCWQLYSRQPLILRSCWSWRSSDANFAGGGLIGADWCASCL